jgi:SAM-dependent methyltransferase
VLAEGGQIPFNSGHFSSVISTSVLEHIQDLKPVFNEVARVLKPGGRFIFCVPNHRFPETLWGRRFLVRMGLNGLGAAYSRLFNRIARHAHTDAPAEWQARLADTGFGLIDSWDYFSPAALHILEWGHLLGLPALFCKKLFNRWVMVPKRWNLALPWRWTRKFMDHPRSEEGVCTFFIAQRLP